MEKGRTPFEDQAQQEIESLRRKDDLSKKGMRLSREDPGENHPPGGKLTLVQQIARNHGLPQPTPGTEVKCNNHHKKHHGKNKHKQN